jgi:hypothetical protein
MDVLELEGIDDELELMETGLCTPGDWFRS